MGSCVPRVWGVDEKRAVAMAGSLPDTAVCARVGLEEGQRLPDERWLPADRERIVCGSCTSSGRWCVAVEQDPGPDEPVAHVKRSLSIQSAPGKQELQLALEGLGDIRAAAWSPDGTKVAIRTDGQVLLYIPGEKKPQRLCGAGPMSEAVWWPAAGLAIVDGRTLRVLDDVPG